MNTHALHMSTSRWWFALLSALTVVGIVASLGLSFLSHPQIAHAASTTIFEDGFENTPKFSNPLWEQSDNKWSTSGASKRTGSKGANVKGNTGNSDDVLKQEESTEGYESVTLSYWFKVKKNLEANDNDRVRVQWYDGSSWTTLYTINHTDNGDGWVQKTHNLPAGADDNANFAFRFVAKLDSQSSDQVYFDDVSLTGNEIKTEILALNLTSVCSADPDETRRWRVHNPNPFDVEVDWEVVGAGQSGTITAKAAGTGEPKWPGNLDGDDYTFFETTTVGGANTTKIYWEDENEETQSKTKASGGATCTGTLIVKKVVENDDDASDLEADDFYFTINGGDPIQFEEDGENEVTTPIGAFTVVETEQSTHSVTYDGCEGELGDAETKVCTITNNDIPPSASLRICKLIVDSEGNIIDGDEVDAEFSVDVTGPDFDETVEFETTLSLDTDLVSNNDDAVDAQCRVFEGLPEGKYEYEAEEIDSDAVWGVPLYHDYFNETPEHTSDFYELTEDGSEGDEDNADGVINLADGGMRTLAIVNTLAGGQGGGDNACTVTIYSDTTNTVTEKGDANAQALSFIHNAWTAVIDGATWIWGDDPVVDTTVDETQTFVRTFEWSGSIASAVLKIATDNYYTVRLNGVEVGSEQSNENNFQIATQDEFSGTLVTNEIIEGVNTLEIEATNKGVSGSSPTSNPAGLLYSLTIVSTEEGDECMTAPVHQCENLLVNGSFEEPIVTNNSLWQKFASVAGWTIQNMANDSATTLEGHRGWSGNAAADGEQYVELDGDHSTKITQSVTTIPGATYELFWAFAPRHNIAAEQNQLSVFIDDILVATEGPATGSAGLTVEDWTESSHVFVAASGSTDVMFADGGPSNSYGTFLDNAQLCLVAEPEEAPYCGDGVVNQEWEQCDGGEQCTDWCQVPTNQCTEDVFARVVVNTISNTGSGDVTSDIYLGQGVNPIPESTWFPLVLGGSPIIDPAISGYADVPGLAVQRADGEVTLLLYGSRTGADKEHANGYIEFHNSEALTQTSLPGQDKLEKGFDGKKKVKPGQDEVWIDSGLSHFWLTTTTADDGYTTTYADAPQCGAKIVAHKIICTDESELPNWGTGGPNIDADTAQDWVDDHKSCSFAADWEFEWVSHSERTDPGDTLVGYAGGNWTTFGPTDESGMTMTVIPTEALESKMWFREVLQEGYIPFTHDQNGNTNADDYSAEFYCHTDVLNYDNYDRLDNAVEEETYYCVGWNHAIPDEPDDAHLTIYKYTDYADGTFEFTVSGSEFLDTFELTTESGSAQSGSIGLAAGTYSVIETVPEGWFYDSENSFCEYNGDSEGEAQINGHYISVEEGDYVSCYFYNEVDQTCPEGYHFDLQSGQCVENGGDSHADVGLTKTVSDETPEVGDTVTYTITATNAGPQAAGSILVYDLLPPGVTYVSHTASNGDDSYDETTGEWDILSLGVEGSATLEITVTVDSGEEGQSILNSAYIEESDSVDNNSENDSASAAITVEDEEEDDDNDNNGPGPGPISPNGGGGNGPISTLGGGLVLGASSLGGQVLGESCGLYLDQHLRQGSPFNSPDQVTKLQEFLNKHGFGSFVPTGFFGPLTFNAVKAFQAEYAEQILFPWNITEPTGLVYLTTIRQINLLECPDLTLGVPELVPWSSNSFIQ